MSSCDCRRCDPAGDSAEDYCYEIAFSIDEEGNFNDDKGIYRDGQTGDEIACHGCRICDTGEKPHSPFWYSGCSNCIIQATCATCPDDADLCRCFEPNGEVVA